MPRRGGEEWSNTVQGLRPQITATTVITYTPQEAVMTKKALVYARLSELAQLEDGSPDLSNTDEQITEGIKYAEARGYEVVETFRDDGISAYRKADRKGFEALLDALRAGKGSVVVARHLDRLSRRRQDTARLFDVCEEHGVLIATYTGQEIDLGTATGKMIASILMSVSQNEQDVKGERAKAAHLRRIKSGKPWWTQAPFGLSKDGKRVEHEAQLVETAVEAILDGKSLRSVCVEWNKAGHFTRRGKEWRSSVLTNYLKNPTIAGIVHHNGTEYRDVEAQWEAVIDRDLFDALQVYLSNPERKYGDRSSSDQGQFLLTGIATDPEGRPVGVGTNTSTGYKVYRTRTGNDSSADGKVARKLTAVDEEVIDQTLTVLTSPLMEKLVYEGESAALITEARKKLADVEKRRRELDEEYGSGELALKTYSRLSAVLDESEDKIKADMLHVRRRTIFADLDLTTMNTVRSVIKRDGWGEVREAWDRIPLERQRAILRELWGKIIVQPGRGKPVECFLREDL